MRAVMTIAMAAITCPVVPGEPERSDVMNIGWVLPVVWVALGVLIVTSSLRSRRSRFAYNIGVGAVSALWVVAGAGANAFFLLRGDDYSGFADGASTSFVHETWESLVVPNHGLFIGLLIAFEALAGIFVLFEGRARQSALLLLIAFNVLLLSFGWGFLVWTVPMVVALAFLWRVGRTTSRTEHLAARSTTTASRERRAAAKATG